MKICVAQTRPFKGDIQRNIEKHKEFIDLAVSNDTDTIIFPELSLTGYEPTLAKELALTQDDGHLDDFQSLSNTHQLTIGIGIPTKNDSGLCISMVLFQPHRPRRLYSKKYLHADEEPFFVSGQNFPSLNLNGTNTALAICYELAVLDHAALAYQSDAEVYIASVAKTGTGVKNASKRLADIARMYSMLVLMSNCVGPSDNFISAGGTAVWNNNGLLLAQLDETSEGILIYDTETQGIIEETV